MIFDTRHCSRGCDLLVLHPVPQTGTLEGRCRCQDRCEIRFQQPWDSCNSLTSMIDCILEYSFCFSSRLNWSTFSSFFVARRANYPAFHKQWRQEKPTCSALKQISRYVDLSPSLMDPLSSSIVNPMRSHQEKLYVHDISFQFPNMSSIRGQFSATHTVWQYFPWSGWPPWTVGWKRSECNLCTAWSATAHFMHWEKKPFPNRWPSNFVASHRGMFRLNKLCG